jgi:Na+-transporting methylmalonyl-CoA/oxaloacetate decarboxylase gamma subunit
MDLIFALVLAAIGMGVVMSFLAAVVIILNALRVFDGMKDRWEEKRSSAPRTKVALTGEDAPKKIEKKVKGEEEDIRQVLAAAVATYLILKDKDALRAAEQKRKRRNVWSVAGKYEMFQQRLGGGKDFNF